MRLLDPEYCDVNVDDPDCYDNDGTSNDPTYTLPVEVFNRTVPVYGPQPSDMPIQTTLDSQVGSFSVGIGGLLLGGVLVSMLLGAKKARR